MGMKLMGKNGLHLGHVTRTSRTRSTPRLVFSADWFADMGFVPGALVQYLPENGGLSFVLCDENIRKYSELLQATKQKNGALIQVYDYKDGPQLCVSGQTLGCTGLKYDDALIARYAYGIIRIRKLSGSSDTPVTLIDSHIVGTWLGEIGFLPDAVFTVDAKPGIITCTLQENDAEKIKARTPELVKYARENKLKLMQVQKKNYLKRVSRGKGVFQYFDIPQSCLNKAGFSTDEMLLAYYQPGQIQLLKPDFVGLGF